MKNALSITERLFLFKKINDSGIIGIALRFAARGGLRRKEGKNLFYFSRR
jgi:hypothetical protein